MDDSEAGVARQNVYDAMIAYDDAVTSVAQLTRMTGDAYRQVVCAIGGHGDLTEARLRFELEWLMLSDAHAQLSGKAAILRVAVADGDEWLSAFAIPNSHCSHCGAAWSPSDPWANQSVCNRCASPQMFVELTGRPL